MILGRRPGSFTSFIDSSSGECVLRLEASQVGTHLVSFHLYDRHGTLVKDSEGLQNYPAGYEVRAPDEELLLHIPDDPDHTVRYCLYNRVGTLLTRSDGLRTQVFGSLRMVGNKPMSGRPPGRPANPT